MMSDKPAQTLDLHVGTTGQLFNSIDPAPFRERRLDPDVVDYIVDWAEDLPLRTRLGINVRIDRLFDDCDDPALIRGAFADNFGGLAATRRRELKRLFRDGRLSLVIGMLFVAATIVLGETASRVITNPASARLVTDSAVIGSWVALWHPINIFLFEWWPIRRKAALFDRLQAAPVQVTGG